MNCSALRWTRGFVFVAAAAFSCFCNAQCPQDWIENGGLPQTDSAGSFTRGAILSTPGHEYTFASGSFNFVDEQPALNFIVYDNDVLRSPFSLPGWEHVSGAVQDIQQFEGRAYFAGSFTVDGIANIPLISWDGTSLEIFPTLTVRANFVSVKSSGGRRIIHLNTNSQPSYVRFDDGVWTSLPNNSHASGIRAIDLLDDVPGGRLVATDGTRLFVLNSDGWQVFPNSNISGTISGGDSLSMRALFCEGHGPEAVLFLGGSFGNINGLTVKNIAANRHGAWEAIGAGVASTVYSMARTSAGGQSELVIATRTGSIIANSTYRALPSVMIYRSASWQPILQSPAEPNSITINSNLLVGGNSHLALLGTGKDRITSALTSALARWDGSNWSALNHSIGSGGVVGAIEQLDLGDGPQIFAGGNFRTSDGALQSIARFDGAHWQPVGAGLPYIDNNQSGVGVTALGVTNVGGARRLIASGYDGSHLFTQMYDGASWADLSSGMSGWNANQFFEYDSGNGPHTYAIVKLSSSPLYWLDGTVWRNILGGNSVSREAFAATAFNGGDGEFIYIGYAGSSQPGTHFVQRWSQATGFQVVDSGMPAPFNATQGVNALFKMSSGGTTALLAGGDFAPISTSSPGVQYLARLNGSTWEQFTPVPPGPVADLAMHDFGSGPVLTAIIYSGLTYQLTSGFLPYRLVNGAWERFGILLQSTTSIYAHNTPVGVLKDIDGTLFVGGLVRTVDGKVSNLIARYGPGHCFCAADINQDGADDFFDYLDYVNAFAAGDAAADFNRDGEIDMFDYLDFVDAFSTGC